MIDTAKAPQTNATTLEKFLIKDEISKRTVAVNPIADFEVSGIVMTLNTPSGNASFLPGTISIAWGNEAKNLLDPNFSVDSIKPDQGMIFVAAVTESKNLKTAVLGLKSADHIRVKGTKVEVGGDGAPLLKSTIFKGFPMEIVFIKEIQIGDTIYRE